MNILVVGGAGYIGSHTVKEIAKTSHNVVVYDSLYKGHREAVQGAPLEVGDLFETDKLESVLRKYEVNAVIHFAADIQVGESMINPAKYYKNNVGGTIHLLDTMQRVGVKNIVFSSTAAVYGNPDVTTITEEVPKQPTNVYGRTKLVVEGMLADFAMAYGLRYTALRYFNAAGADPEGHIGEDHDPESHLIPLILKTALGQRSHIDIFGTDYPTPDGTCIRDYIHIVDLAQAHILALEALRQEQISTAYNLGNGTGFSVRQVLEEAERVTGREIAYVEKERRSGDPAVLVASSAKISRELGWKPQFGSLTSIIETAWNWHKQRPEGY